MPHFRATFQAKFFVAALAASLIALAVAGALFATTMRAQIDRRIEDTLVAEARVAADLLSRAGPLGNLGLLFTPQAMVMAQTILIVPILAALWRNRIGAFATVVFFATNVGLSAFRYTRYPGY